jgi:uncharacterized protein YcfL
MAMVVGCSSLPRTLEHEQNSIEIQRQYLTANGTAEKTCFIELQKNVPEADRM